MPSSPVSTLRSAVLNGVTFPSFQFRFQVSDLESIKELVTSVKTFEPVLRRRVSSRSLPVWTSSESLLEDIVFSPPSISAYLLSPLDHGISGLAIGIHFSINHFFAFFFLVFSILLDKCILKRPSFSSHPFPTKYTNVWS